MVSGDGIPPILPNEIVASLTIFRGRGQLPHVDGMWVVHLAVLSRSISRGLSRMTTSISILTKYQDEIRTMSVSALFHCPGHSILSRIAFSQASLSVESIWDEKKA
jgi:hypothetical protein